MSFLFDTYPPFHPADIEPLQGDGDRVRSAGRMLHDAAGALDFAQRSANQLQVLTDGVSWRGAAFQAFKGSLDKQPLPNHLVNARDVLGWTGDELSRLATKLDEIQSEFARLRQRADLLGVDGDVPEERRPEVDAIRKEYEELKDRRERALDQAAHVFDEMTDKTVFARPKKGGLFGKVTGALKGAMNFTKSFASGIVEGTVDIGKGLVLIGSLATPGGMRRAVEWYRDNRHLIGSAMVYAMHNPLGMAKEVGKVMIDYDTMTKDPGRWLGKLVPQVAIAVATAGVGGMASRTAAQSTRVPTGLLAREARQLGDYVTHIDRARRGVGNFGETAQLSKGVAFKKGIYDTFANKPYRNLMTGTKYGKARRLHYMLHGRKEMPAWGKFAKKVPAVTAAAAAASESDDTRTTLADVLEQGATEATYG